MKLTVLCLLLFVIFFIPIIEGGTTHLPVTVLRFITITTLLLWFFDILKTSRVLKICEISIKRTPFDIPIILFLILSIISTILSPYKDTSIQWLITIVSYIFLFYIVLNFINKYEDKITLFLFAVIIMGLFEALFGILQIILKTEIRARGTFFNSNFLAGYLVLSFSISFSNLLEKIETKFLRSKPSALTDFNLSATKIRSSSFYFQKIPLPIWLLISLILFVGILSTASRGGILALLVSSSIILWYRSKKFLLIFLIAILIFLFLFPNPFLQRLKIESSVDIYNYSRISIWKNALKMMLDNIWFGVGLGMYKFEVLRYSFPVEGRIGLYAKKATTAHNEYLQFSAEMGIFALILIITTIIIFIKRSNDFIKETKNGVGDRHNSILLPNFIGIMGGILGTLSHSMVDSNWREPGVIVTTIILSGLIMPYYDSKQSITISISYKKRYYLYLLLIYTLFAILILQPFLGYYSFYYGRKALVNNEIEKAQKLFLQATFFNPRNSSYYSSLANIHFNKFREDKSEDSFKKTIELLNYARRLNPKDVDYYIYSGMVYKFSMSVFENKYELYRKSLECYITASYLDPYNVFVLSEIGKLYLQFGEIDSALSYFEKSVELEPYFLEGRYYRSVIYEMKGMWKLAGQGYVDIMMLEKRCRNQSKYFNDYEKSLIRIDIDKVSERSKFCENKVRELLKK